MRQWKKEKVYEVAFISALYRFVFGTSKNDEDIKKPQFLMSLFLRMYYFNAFILISHKTSSVNQWRKYMPNVMPFWL